MKEMRPPCRERFLELERDMRGAPGDEFGLRRKVGIMWTDHLKRKEADKNKKVAWGTLLQFFFAFLQSGLLILLLTGGKMS
jgi:hypothetical protein